MKNHFPLKHVFVCLMAAGVGGGCSLAQAAAFQLWEQDGASVGNYHAGRAASAEDASTAWYNPAGLVRIKNQQLVLGADPIITDFRFHGDLSVASIPLSTSTGTTPVVAQGGNVAVVPNLHYAAPINPSWVFGLSVVAPFGLQTNYGSQNFINYAGKKAMLTVVDITPSLGFAINDHFSVGAGVDAEHAAAEFSLLTMIALPGNIGSVTATDSDNFGSSWAWGYHFGALYTSVHTRAGLAWQSRFNHHLEGRSKFTGPLAENGVYQSSNTLRASLPLPATATLSLFHGLNQSWDLMGTVSYTQWSVFKNLVFKNVAGVDASGANSNSIVATVPEHFTDSWNFSVGSNYHVNEQWLIRMGAGYDQSPTRGAYRNIQLPDSDRIALAVGTHYQLSSALGFDFGWTHLFAMNTRINNLSQPVGAQVTTTNGSIRAAADVLGLQVKWDIV